MVVIVKVTMWLQGIKDKLFKLFMQDILRRLNYMYMEYF